MREHSLENTRIFKTILVNYNNSVIMSIAKFLIKNISFRFAFSWKVQKIKLYSWNERVHWIHIHFRPFSQKFKNISFDTTDGYYRFYLRSIYRGHNEWIKRVQRTIANYSSFVCWCGRLSFIWWMVIRNIKGFWILNPLGRFWCLCLTF